MEGMIVRIIESKGFGFIRGTDGKEYFFHRDDIHGFFDDIVSDINIGRDIKVTFNPLDGPRGPRAANVTRMDNGV